MNKINGYTEEEAKNLVDYVANGKREGKTLSGLFASYAKKTGRAKGSVRNYYYSQLKMFELVPNKGDDRVKNLLKDKEQKEKKILPFTEEETDRILKEILKQKSKGVSVRRAVLNLSHGDDKLMLRYQNKYRNVAMKQPERIEKLMRECGLNGGDGMRRRIEEEINGLYDKLASSLKEENRRLTAMIKRLTDENALLRLQLRNN